MPKHPEVVSLHGGVIESETRRVGPIYLIDPHGGSDCVLNSTASGVADEDRFTAATFPRSPSNATRWAGVRARGAWMPRSLSRSSRGWAASFSSSAVRSSAVATATCASLAFWSAVAAAAPASATLPSVSALYLARATAAASAPRLFKITEPVVKIATSTATRPATPSEYNIAESHHSTFRPKSNVDSAASFAFIALGTAAFVFLLMPIWVWWERRKTVHVMAEATSRRDET